MGKGLAVGMTIGRRVNGETIYDYATKAIASYRDAGFQQPLYVFVEPGAEIHVPDPRHWGLIVCKNQEKLGCFKNFKHGAQVLIDNTSADWILMLQDDAVWRPNGAALLREAIEAPEHQKVGFLSPYTGKAMVDDRQKRTLKKRLKEGMLEQRWVRCHFHNKAFWGAVAMCFPRASLIKMQTEGKRYINHNHTRKLDVVVGNTMRRDLELEILMASPSLVDHIGSWSTLGRHRFKGNQWGRRGFAFGAGVEQVE